MTEKKYLDQNGLAHLGLLIKGNFVKRELKTGSTSEYKILSDNNLTDELLEKIQNAGDSSFTGNYNDLTNKPDLTVFPTKTEVTTEINNAVANINKKEIVSTIEEMTDSNTIYLIANNGESNNIYDEYIVINNVAEKIGSTEIDLTGYIRKEDIIPITNAEIETILSD